MFFLKRAALAVAVVVSFAGPAFAEETPPPASGWFGTFDSPSVNCDTAEQIKAIVEAAKAKPDGGGQAKYNELAAIKDRHGEATCMFGAPTKVAAAESVDLGKFELEPNKWVHGWAVHVGMAAAEWWFLYVQPASGPASLEVPMLLPHGLRRI